ncbi:MAG: hypothetical protein K9I85_01320 [Saprospiraceae bacterium]|nr:hypothetical protein [Saprospiraceae bacterium]
MYQFLNKYGQVAAFGLGLLIIILFFVSVLSGVDEFNGLGKEAQLQSGIFNLGLYASIFLTLLCAAAILIFGIYQIAKHPKQSMQGIIQALILVAIFIVGYAMSTPAETGLMATLAERFELTPGQEKFISGGLTTALVLFAAAAGAFIVSEVRNLFK